MSLRALPLISFVIPVYNEEKRITSCLKSIFSQNYPKDRIEVLVIDGGSTDKTVQMSKSFTVRVIHNKNRDAESGLSLGIHHSKGEILVLWSADQQLGSKEWLNKMLKPLLENSEIFGVKSFWLHRKSDPIVNRYCMFLQIADPLARVLDARTSRITEDHDGYSINIVDKDDVPLIGCELIWRKDVILKVGNYAPRFEEANFVDYVVHRGFNKYGVVPDAGIYHQYVQSIRGFINKRVKIAWKFLNRIQARQVTWVHNKGSKKLLYAILFCVSMIGPTIEAVQGYKETRDVAWFLHPLMCFLTVLTYAATLTIRLVKGG